MELKIITGGKDPDLRPTLVINNRIGERCYVVIDLRKAWFRTLLRTLPLGAIMVDSEGTLLYSNDKSSEIGFKLGTCVFQYIKRPKKLQDKIGEVFKNEDPIKHTVILKANELTLMEFHLMSIRFTKFNKVAAWIEEKG